MHPVCTSNCCWCCCCCNKNGNAVVRIVLSRATRLKCATKRNLLFNMEMSTKFCQWILFLSTASNTRQIPFTCLKLHDSVFSVDSLAKVKQNVVFFLFISRFNQKWAWYTYGHICWMRKPFLSILIEWNS